MRLYWDLAMRLLWGSRLNASTRMTALLALAILVSSAFGVVVVGMVNKGFSAILNAEATRLRAAPENLVVFTEQLKRGDANLRYANARMEEGAHEFARALGNRRLPEWDYRAAYFLLAPEHDIPRLLAATHQKQAMMPDPPSRDASKVELNTYVAQLRKVDQVYQAQLEGVRLRTGSLCAAPGVGPTRLDEIWVQRTWGQFGQQVGTSWVALLDANMDPAGPARGLPLHRKVRVVRLAPITMRAVECMGWISPRLMDIVQRRQPQLVSRQVAWRGPGVPRTEKKWFGEEGQYRFGTKAQAWVVGRISNRDDAVLREQNLRAADKVLGVQRLVSWLVVGMMGALAIYQVCSLMMMLGLHFRFDVAMLRSLGMSRTRVMLVFVVSSLAIMGVGLGLGMLAAWWWLPHMNDQLAWLLSRLDAKDMVDWVPWVPDRAFALRAFAVGMGLGLVAGLIPAWMASRARPSDIWKAET